VKHVLILGAGHSTSYLVSHLLAEAEQCGGRVTVADLDLGLARRRVAGHPCGRAVRLDIRDEPARASLIGEADVVVSMLVPAFQPLVAQECVRLGRSLVSTSYRDRAVRELDDEARRRGVLLLSETGLDPGIDHISAMDLLGRVRAAGGRIRGFRSYGAGIPAPDAAPNALRYVITWNPRNVVLAGAAGAQYVEGGRIRIVPYPRVFESTWRVPVDGVGDLEAYPNRDSLSYREAFGLRDTPTMIRATLRWPGFCETWAQIVRIGLANDSIRIPDLGTRTYRDVTSMFVPGPAGASLESRLGHLLGVDANGPALDRVRGLGLLADERTGCSGETAADMLTELLVRKLPLGVGDRDMVLLVHEIEVDYPGTMRSAERITATLVAFGEPGGCTAMARTVGMPAAIAATLVARGAMPLVGSHIPTHPAVYEPVLRELRSRGVEFVERVEPLA